MTDSEAISLGREFFYHAVLLTTPALVVSLIVGMIVSIFQAVTNIQEQTLSFAPRILALAGLFVLTMPWLLQMSIYFTVQMFSAPLKQGTETTEKGHSRAGCDDVGVAVDGILTIWVMTFGLILARVSSFIATIPYLGGQNVPRLIKAGTAVALTCFWFIESGATSVEVVAAMDEQPWLAFGMAIGREVLIGAALGYIFGLFLVPFRVAGEYISQEMGLTLGEMTDPTRPQTTTVFGEFFEIFGALLFFTQDIHHLFLASLHGSFARQPIGGSILTIPVATQLSSLASATEWGLSLAAPIGCCLFITSLILGLMSRAAPQMNMISLGYGLRVIAGLFSVFLLWPNLAPRMNQVLQNYSRLLIGQ